MILSLCIDDTHKFHFWCKIHECFSNLSQFPELSFKRRFLTFLNENRNYFPDLKFNVSLENASRAELWSGAFEITASRYAKTTLHGT